MLVAAFTFTIASVGIINTQAQNATSTELGQNASDIGQSILDMTQKASDKIMRGACKITKDCETDKKTGFDVNDDTNTSDSKTSANIVLLSQKFNEAGKYGYDKILGQVKNIGNASAYSVEIGATVFDKNGDVIATKTGYPDADVLKSGQKSTFDITFLSFENVDEMESYELSLQWGGSNYDSTPQYVENAQVYKDNSTKSSD